MDVFDVLLVLVTGDSELQGGIFQHPDIISTPVFFFINSMTQFLRFNRSLEQSEKENWRMLLSVT